jgi:hypothetical protein
METQAFNTLALVYLMFLSMWGGVVATEAVIEVYPFRRPDGCPDQRSNDSENVCSLGLFRFAQDR